jgi:hypothetical protein
MVNWTPIYACLGIHKNIQYGLKIVYSMKNMDVGSMVIPFACFRDRVLVVTPLICVVIKDEL